MNSIKYSKLFLSIFAFLIFFSCGGTKKATPKITGISFEQSETLSDILDQAKAENKSVFVDFYADWCIPCKMMEKDVFTDKNVANYFNKNFVSYRINIEKGNGGNLALIYDVSVLPTLIFLDNKGRVLHKNVGSTSQTKLLEMAKSFSDELITSKN